MTPHRLGCYGQHCVLTCPRCEEAIRDLAYSNGMVQAAALLDAAVAQVLDGTASPEHVAFFADVFTSTAWHLRREQQEQGEES